VWLRPFAPRTIGSTENPRRQRLESSTVPAEAAAFRKRRLRGRPRFGVRGRPRFGRFQVDSEADLGFGEVAVDAAPGSV
jgi:hypothetical protein